MPGFSGTLSRLPCRHWVAVLALAAGLLLHLGAARAQPQPQPDAAQALRTQHTALSEQLQHNAFGRPLVLASAETPQGLRGDIYALVVFPFAAVSSALQDPQQWCEVMILHLNTKYCHAAPGPQGTVLSVNIGSKTPEELAQAERVALHFTQVTSQSDYFQVRLTAAQGPLGTSDYHIGLEAIALSPRQTFLHLTYSYGTGLMGQLAMKAYLATAGHDKVGFTVIGEPVDGHPAWIDGVRAVVERNTMRYYLAIDSYLGSAGQPPGERFERGLQSWFTATEQYPRQLHEIERPAYLTMKRAEHLRQQTAQ